MGVSKSLPLSAGKRRANARGAEKLNRGVRDSRVRWFELPCATQALATEPVRDGGSLVAIGRLRAVVAQLAELEDGGDAACQWFAERLGGYCRRREDYRRRRLRACTNAETRRLVAQREAGQARRAAPRNCGSVLCQRPSERCRADNIASRIARLP